MLTPKKTGGCTGQPAKERLIQNLRQNVTLTQDFDIVAIDLNVIP
jgi:hypothetical protein